MAISIVIYFVITMLTLQYAATWLTTGKAAFVPRESKTLVMRLGAIALITALYTALSIAMGIGAPLMVSAIFAILGKNAVGLIAFTLAFAALDVLVLAVAIRISARIMNKTLTAQTFFAAVCASLIITALTSVAQEVVTAALAGLAQ